MYTKKLDRIQQVLEENLDLIWENRLVYNYYDKTYHSADMFDFGYNKSTYVHLIDNKNKGYLARVKLNSQKFVIDLNGMKIDVSDHWQELSSKALVTSSIK